MKQRRNHAVIQFSDSEALIRFTFVVVLFARR